MMRRRPAHIPLRKPIFIGCEGDSEQAYAALLNVFAAEQDLPVHLIVEVLGPGAGDPLARVDMAVRKLKHMRKTRGAPKDRFVFLDSDQAERDPARAEQARQLAARNNILIIWQEPCFEAVLLRHLPNCASRRPPDTPGAQQALEQRWPGYAKPMTRIELAKRIDQAAVLQAASVEPGLLELLRCLGLAE